MKNIFFFVFLLTFALVLGRQDVQKKSIASSIFQNQKVTQNTARALERLEEVGLPTFETWKIVRERSEDPPVSKRCEEDMKEKEHLKEEGILYDFQKTCYLIGTAVGNDNLVLNVKSKYETGPSGWEECANTPAFQAVYLPYEYNANTYMILDPTMAPWFFTAPLSGCDIFVATNPQKPNKPIVIHSNLNKFKENNLENLQFKGMYADEILAVSHPGYQLIARVYHKPSPKEEMDTSTYLEKYKIRHQQIMLLSYPPATPQFFLFFGHYDKQKVQWNFLLKGEKDGVTTSFGVSAKGNVVWVGSKKP